MSHRTDERIIMDFLVYLMNTRGNNSVYNDFVDKYLPEEFHFKSISDMVDYIVKNNIKITG